MNRSSHEKTSPYDGQNPEIQDYIRYFKTYSLISHQRSMLEDHKRTGAYYRAMLENKQQFKDKVVLDVGTGSGILAMFAARAGAKKVYAVEATSMAQNARALVRANNLQDIVTVIQGTIETVELPEKVDIIVSEWMGYLLLRESMLDSVLVARDRYLKPGGALYPSHARMYWAPIQATKASEHVEEYHKIMEHWEWFATDMKKLYGIDMTALTDAYDREQEFIQLSYGDWADVRPGQLLGKPIVSKTLDLHTVTLEELKAGFSGEGATALDRANPIDAICSWFDVSFRGSSANPCATQVDLSTAPDDTGATHWGQTVFYLNPPLEPKAGDKLHLGFAIHRREDYERLLRVQLSTQLLAADQTAVQAPKLREYLLD